MILWTLLLGRCPSRAWVGWGNRRSLGSFIYNFLETRSNITCNVIPAGEAAPAELRKRLSLYENYWKNPNPEKSNFWEETASVTSQVHLPVPHSLLCSLPLIPSCFPAPNFCSPSYPLIISRSFPMLNRKPLISENDKLQNWVIKLHCPSSQVLPSIVFSLITFFRSCQTAMILISSSHTGCRSCGLWTGHCQQHYPCLDCGFSCSPKLAAPGESWAFPVPIYIKAQEEKVDKYRQILG